MKTEFINPFIIAAFSVLESVLGETPEKGETAVQSDRMAHSQMTFSIGITGAVTGHVMIGMDYATADNVASKMVGSRISHVDSLAASALAELTNMICGNGLMHLGSHGLICDMTPPTIISGMNIEISTLAVPALIVPLTLEIGEVYVTVSLVQVK